jgi:hypothetical protein
MDFFFTTPTHGVVKKKEHVSDSPITPLSIFTSLVSGILVQFSGTF